MINTASRQIDWDKVRRRLTEAAEATRAAAHISPERARAIMDERTRELARVPPVPPRAADFLEVVTFTAADERFGIETCCVRTVVRPQDFTPVPGTPEFVIGVTNLRGEVLAVIDLVVVLGHAAQSAARPWVVVLATDRVEFGIVADSVQEVAKVRIDEVLEPAGGRHEFLRGVTKEALAVLDGKILLSDSRLYVDETEESRAEQHFQEDKV